MTEEPTQELTLEQKVDILAQRMSELFEDQGRHRLETSFHIGGIFNLLIEQGVFTKEDYERALQDLGEQFREANSPQEDEPKEQLDLDL